MDEPDVSSDELPEPPVVPSEEEPSEEPESEEPSSDEPPSEESPEPSCSNVFVSSSYWPSCTIGLFRSYGYCGYRSAICCGPRRLVSRARSISSCMLPRRSQAIAFSQATESTGVHSAGL